MAFLVSCVAVGARSLTDLNHTPAHLGTKPWGMRGTRGLRVATETRIVTSGVWMSEPAYWRGWLTHSNKRGKGHAAVGKSDTVCHLGTTAPTRCDLVGVAASPCEHQPEG